MNDDRLNPPQHGSVCRRHEELPSLSLHSVRKTDLHRYTVLITDNSLYGNKKMPNSPALYSRDPLRGATLAHCSDLFTADIWTCQRRKGTGVTDPVIVHDASPVKASLDTVMELCHC